MKTTKMVARIAGLVLAGMMVMGLASCGGNPVKGKTFSDGSLTIEFKDGKNVVFDGMPERPWDKNPVLKTTYKITGKGYKKTETKIDFNSEPNATSPSYEELVYDEEKDELTYDNYSRNSLKRVNK